MKKIVVIIFASILCLAFLPAYKPIAEVPYPDGYRKWTHIKTGIIGSKNPHFKTYGGFHHIYANQKAMEGYDCFSKAAMIVMLPQKIMCLAATGRKTYQLHCFSIHL